MGLFTTTKDRTTTREAMGHNAREMSNKARKLHSQYCQGCGRSISHHATHCNKCVKLGRLGW